MILNLKNKTKTTQSATSSFSFLKYKTKKDTFIKQKVSNINHRYGW